MALDLRIRRKLDRGERHAIATALVRADRDGNTPHVPGAERLHERGGRILASLGGMYLELIYKVASQELDLHALPRPELLRLVTPALRPAYRPDQLSDADISKIVPAMIHHWRDGDFRDISFDHDGVSVIRIALVFKEVFEIQEVDGVPGSERWPADALVGYWERETSRYENGRGRW